MFFLFLCVLIFFIFCLLIFSHFSLFHVLIFPFSPPLLHQEEHSLAALALAGVDYLFVCSKVCVVHESGVLAQVTHQRTSDNGSVVTSAICSCLCRLRWTISGDVSVFWAAWFDSGCMVIRQSTEEYGNNFPCFDVKVDLGFRGPSPGHAWLESGYMFTGQSLEPVFSCRLGFFWTLLLESVHAFTVFDCGYMFMAVYGGRRIEGRIRVLDAALAGLLLHTFTRKVRELFHRPPCLSAAPVR